MPFSTISSHFRSKVLYIASTKKITPWKIGSQKIAPDPNPNPSPNPNSGVNLMRCSHPGGPLYRRQFSGHQFAT